jgi:RhtX/FptX family siderophore transporter
MLQKDDVDPNGRRKDDHGLIALIGALYVTQGVPLGVSMVAVPTMLRQAGASLEMIGLASLAMLPWAIKFLWAPMVDNRRGGRFGHRRSWIIPLQASLAVLMAAAGFIPLDASGQWLLIALVTAANIVSATKDIATDGLAVDRLAQRGRGRSLAWANGLQVGGFAGGMFVGGPLVLIAVDWLGSPEAFLFLGLLLSLTLIPVILWREAGPLARRAPQGASLRRFFQRPGAIIMLSVAALFHAQQMMALTLVKPWLVDIGASATLVAIISGVAIILLALGSGLVGGVVVSRFGIGRSAAAGLFLGWLAGSLWIGVTLLDITDPRAIVAVTAIAGIFSGVAYVAFFALFMRWAFGEQAATDFTLLQCAESCGGIVLSSAVSAAAGKLGYPAAFSLAALIGFVALMTLLGPARRLVREASDAVAPDMFEDSAEVTMAS